MSQEKEYIVIINESENLQEIEEEIKALTGDGFIPNRKVEVANERIASQRMTHFYLTDEEADLLRKDSRILDVEIPIEHRDDIEISLNAYQDSIFYRGRDYTNISNDSRAVNWGLRRHIEETNIYNGSRKSPSTPYEYAVDGTGVDIVIMDTGVQVDHPEFLNENGVSRVQQIDWYQEAGITGTLGPKFYEDQDGHGTHCAGIAAGKTQGWAKNAHIYSMKIFDDDELPTTTAMDLVKLWHQNKTNGRPTVVNMSFGSYGFGISPAQPPENISGTYRGQDWSWADDLEGSTYRLEKEKGWLFKVIGWFWRRPSRVSSIDVALDEMIDAGIHVCIAAGNMPFKIDTPDGPDYNNVLYERSEYSNNVWTHYYHRGSSPYSSNAINVGAIDDIMEQTSDRITYYTARGPGVDIWAAGDDIMSSIPTSNYSFKNGTSMACPQVVGVIAQHLQVNPNLTPEQMKARLVDDSKSVIYDTGNDTSYKDTKSLVGGPNRILYSRYGKQPYKIKGNLTYRK